MADPFTIWQSRYFTGGGPAAAGRGLGNYSIGYSNGTLTVTAPAAFTAGVPQFQGGNAMLGFAGTPEVRYVTEMATNLAEAWVPVSTDVADENGNWTVTKTTAANQEFFRAYIP
jgi:hypothetical protein